MYVLLCPEMQCNVMQVCNVSSKYVAKVLQGMYVSKKVSKKESK